MQCLPALQTCRSSGAAAEPPPNRQRNDQTFELKASERGGYRPALALGPIVAAHQCITIAGERGALRTERAAGGGPREMRSDQAADLRVDLLDLLQDCRRVLHADRIVTQQRNFEKRHARVEQGFAPIEQHRVGVVARRERGRTAAIERLVAEARRRQLAGQADLAGLDDLAGAVIVVKGCAMIDLNAALRTTCGSNSTNQLCRCGAISTLSTMP